MNETVSISMSGSLPTRFGFAWWRVCLLTHQAWLMPTTPAREDAREAVVRGAGREDRAVRGLVGEERDLREDDAEGAGDEQLEPAVAQQDEPGDRAAEGEREHSADDGVEPRRARAGGPSRLTTCDTSVYVRVRWGKSPVLAYVVRIGPAVDSRTAVEEMRHPLDRQPRRGRAEPKAYADR